MSTMSSEHQLQKDEQSINSAALRRKPLVEYCTNEWRSDPRYDAPVRSLYGDLEPEDFYEKVDRWVDALLAIIKAPRLRRLLLSVILIVLFSTLLWFKVVGPYIKEERAAWASLNRQAAANAGGLFGTNARPEFPGMIQVSNLDSKMLPSLVHQDRRLIFIGDIHGCKTELEALLQKVKFNPSTDHIVTVGDIVNKGPDSLGVIDLLRSLKASCVRGNHDDRLLLYSGQAKGTSVRPNKNGHKKPSSKHHSEKELARELSHDQIAYLRSFPLVLRIGWVEGIGDIVVVHAGLVPGISIDSQDPSSIMNMRIIDLKTHVPSKKHHRKNSTPWFNLWNKFQKLLPDHSKLQKSGAEADGILFRRTTVIYGHDSKRGLQIGKYTKGLDSGCVKGGQLTALIIGNGGQQEIVQVDCKQDYTKKVDIDKVLQGREDSSSDENG